MSHRGRRTNYAGTSMRSRLEAGFAAHLDAHGGHQVRGGRGQAADAQEGTSAFTWRYEPAAYANRHGQYLPDFQIEIDAPNEAGRLAFVEVKPTNAEALGAHVRMRIILDTHPHAELWTASPVKGTEWGDDTYRPELATWRIDRVPTHRPGNLEHTLRRGGHQWTDDHPHGPGWFTTIADQLICVTTSPATASEEKWNHPDTWVLIADPTSIDGPRVHLTEIGRDGTTTDTYLGHHFTQAPIDRLRDQLGAAALKAVS
jgi:hypothetical protein